MNKNMLHAAAVLLLIGNPEPGHAWDPIKDLTGKRADEHIGHIVNELRNAPENHLNCIRDIVRCSEETIKRIPYMYLAPVVERYKQHLFNQGEGRWQKLPPYFVLTVQRHYPGINLDNVRYATNVNTLHGKHITWHNHIFFVTDIDLTRDSDVTLMLHELEHVLQYERRGGEQPFVGEYVLKSVGKVIQTGSFDVHDYLDLEREAETKAVSIRSTVLDDISAVRASRPAEVAQVIDESGRPAVRVNNPLIQGRTLDACINSPAFPEDRRTQCTEPAQRLIADAFCREQGRPSALKWNSEFIPRFQSSVKFFAEVLPGGAIRNARWVQDDRGGAIFTSITCRA
jgi:hypothetical protein